MNIRKAKIEELNEIFLMGYDVWHEGQSTEEYLASSLVSTEYEDGEWYVLENPTTNELLSSLILYDFHTKQERIYGIGSVATPHHFRKKGYASLLIQHVLAMVLEQTKEAYILLYSDINPVFYEKLGFVKAPEQMQHDPHKVCMIYPATPPYL